MHNADARALALSQAEVERLDEWITAYAYDKKGFKI